MKNFKFSKDVLFVLLAIVLTEAECLKIQVLEVPSSADMFSPVTLRCEYDLEGTNLYSVKWYKDGSEFFRYMPDYDPQSQAVKTSGISVDLKKSDKNKVTLTNLRFNNSGNYKCEVSAEGPSFGTDAKSANMTVMAFPSEDPLIEGILSTYSIGDKVSANCTSGKSYPPATITWYINNEEVIPQPDTLVWEYRNPAEERTSQKLQPKTVGLTFQIRSSHAVNNGAGPKVEIRCTSTLGTSIRHTTLYPALLRTLTSDKLAQEMQNSANVLVTTSLNILPVLLKSLQMLYTS